MESADHPTWAHSVEDALSQYALHTLRALDCGGWDQPTSLWALYLKDSAAESPGASLTFTMSRLAEFDDFTADSLVGWYAPSDAVAVALACECWTYHPDRDPGGSDLGPPSLYDDSLELRVLHIAMRDGTELLASHFRSGPLDDTVILGAQAGRVPQAVRRVKDLPSNPVGLLPTVEEIRGRLIPALGYLALCSVRTFAQRSLLEELQDALPLMYADLVGHLGLHLDTWEGSLRAARSASGELDPVLPASLNLRVLLPWTDAPLWALILDDAIPTRSQTFNALADLLPEKKLDPGIYATAVEILSAQPSGGNY